MVEYIILVVRSVQNGQSSDFFSFFLKSVFLPLLLPFFFLKYFCCYCCLFVCLFVVFFSTGEEEGFHCQARCEHDPWRQFSLYDLSLQLDNGGGSSHPCPSLDCLRRWQSDHTYAIILTDSMSLLQKRISGMGSPDWHMPTFDVNIRRLLWMFCCGHAGVGVKRNGRAYRLAGKAAIRNGLRLGRSLVLMSLRHCLLHKAKDSTPSTAWKRWMWKAEELDDRSWTDAEEPASFRRTLDLFQWQRRRNILQTGWNAHRLFRAYRCHLELNWAKLLLLRPSLSSSSSTFPPLLPLPLLLIRFRT